MPGFCRIQVRDRIKMADHTDVKLESGWTCRDYKCFGHCQDAHIDFLLIF